MSTRTATRFTLGKLPPAPATYSQSNEAAFRRALELSLSGLFVAMNDTTLATAGLPLLGWTHDLVFSAVDHDTVQWSGGGIYLPNGAAYAIQGGSVNLSTVTYIYFDLAVSETQLQATETASFAVGANRILIAVANRVEEGKKAQFQVFGGRDDSDLQLITADVVAANALTGNEIAGNTITGANIAGGTITGAHIQAGSIEAQHIRAGAVLADHIDVDTLEAVSADMGTLTAGSIVLGVQDRIWLNDQGDGTLAIGGTDKLNAPFRVTAEGALVATMATITGTLTAGSVIADNVVTSGAIQDGAITAPKIASAAVIQQKIADGAVTTAKLFDEAVTSAKLGPGAVLTQHIDDEAVTTAKLLDEAITAAKLGPGSVITAKLAQEAVTAEKLGPHSVSLDKLFVGSFDNLVLNPGYEQGAGAALGDGWTFIQGSGESGLTAVVDSTHARTGNRCVRVSAAGSTASFGGTAGHVLGDSRAFIAVSEGDQLYIEAYVKRLGPGTPPMVGIGFRGYDANGNFVFAAPAASYTPAETYERVSFSRTVPAGVAYIVPDVRFSVAGAQGSATADVVLDDFYARRMVEGSIVVSGTITADHIAADAIQAQHIDAGAVETQHLKAGAVTATAIASHTIGTQHLLVGSFDNLVTNGGFEQPGGDDSIGAGWEIITSAGGTWQYRSQTAIAHGGQNAVQYNPTGQTNFAKIRNSSGDGLGWIDVAEGGEYYGEVWVRCASAGTSNRAQIRFEWYDSNGNFIEGVSGSAVTTTTTYQKSSVVATAPDGASRLYVVLQVWPDGGTIEVIFDDVYVRRRLTGDLVVDGAIRANHIAAGEIEAVHLQAGAVTADAIAANSVGLRQLFVGSFDNLAVNGGFEQSTSPDHWSMFLNQAPIAINTTDARSGSRCLEISPQPSSNNFLGNVPDGSTSQSFHSVGIAVSQGDKIYMEFWARAKNTTPANPVRARLRWVTADVGNAGETLSSAVTLTTSWQKISLVGTAPTGAAWVIPQVRFDGNGNSGAVLIDDFYVRRMVEGSIIVDGSITAQHIESISLSVLQAAVTSLSAITANMGTLTAGSIVIGSTNRLWLNDGGDGALAIGGTNKASAPFRVTASGALTATQATISGTITASSVVAATSFTATNPIFSGNLFVRSGTGQDLHRFLTASGMGAVYQLTDAGGQVRGQVYVDNTTGAFHLDADQDLTIDAVGGTLRLTGVGSLSRPLGIELEALSGSGIRITTDKLELENLPTFDTGVPGRVWIDMLGVNGPTLMIST